MDAILEGGCFCKAVRYRIKGTPSNTMVCHCQSCRRVAAAPVVAWVTFNKADFEFVQGTPARFHSSKPVTRTFCPTCGTALTYETEKFPDMIDITTCSLDDPSAFPPTHHSWLSQDV